MSKNLIKDEWKTFCVIQSNDKAIGCKFRFKSHLPQEQMIELLRNLLNCEIEHVPED